MKDLQLDTTSDFAIPCTLFLILFVRYLICSFSLMNITSDFVIPCSLFVILFVPCSLFDAS